MVGLQERFVGMGCGGEGGEEFGMGEGEYDGMMIV